MATSPHDPSLLRLCSRLGVPPPRLHAPLGPGVEGALLAPDDGRLENALAEHLGEPWPEAPARAWCVPAAAALRSWLAVSGRVTLASDPATLMAAALEEATAASGRQALLAIEPLGQRPTAALPISRASAGERMAARDVAAVVFEPLLETPEDIGELRQLLRRARDAGARVIADESRTAGRVHAGSSARALALDVDEILLGPAIACGQAFAARLQLGNSDDVVTAGVGPDALALALARSTARTLARQPVAAELAALGQAMRDAFASACAREHIVAALVGPAALARFKIATQEGTPAQLLHWHFAVELERAGVRASEWCVAHAGWTQQADRLRLALAATVGRMRTLLIENNSYISGGLPFVFPTPDATLRQRGLGIYRFPKRAPVDVTVAGDRVRIAFAKGSLGEIVSSGFFVPTRLTGDFEVEAEYDLPAWSSGPDSACFGLFFQNDLSTGRYYAQRTIAGSDDRVLGSFDGALTPAASVLARAGAFRLARVGRRVTAWHRQPGGPWRELGATDTATPDDGIVGAKIWSKVECDGLVAEVSALRLRATLAASQNPPLPIRPDPRAR